MTPQRSTTIFVQVFGIGALLIACSWAAPARAQGRDAHLHALHTPGVSGVPRGVPYLCANPTITSAATGEWTNPRTWSTGKVPTERDKVSIAAGHTVTYGAVSDAALDCIEVGGRLTFKVNADTRMKVVTIMVLENGVLEVGTAATPVAADVTSEIVIADKPLNVDLDPGQIGNGIVVLGKVTMHGGIKAPTFLRLSREPLAGDTSLAFEQAVDGWRSGDRLVIPDTRHLRSGEIGRHYRPQAEVVQIASLAGTSVTLTAPLAHDHKGARGAGGAIELLPHVGNLSRNVVIRSENPAGVRGHMLSVSRADVDVRYVEFNELGRTRVGTLNNTRFDTEGRVAAMGTNQIGRYAVHFHHTFGPRTTPANGYQFTVVGNVVNGAPKWGITVHNSHYGLIKDNVVYNTHGGGIVTEDGTESFNVFDHNLSLLTAGSRDAAPNNGYSGVLPNPGGEGSAFWFRGPNNYIRNNVAANATESGFALSATALGTVRVPRFKGADTSVMDETLPFDTEVAEVPAFSNNEAYGAVRNGVAWAWSGTIADFTVWHASVHGVSAKPTQKLVVDALKARGDPAVLAGADENPVGVWVGNYVATDVTVSRANVQGLRIGVLSPFFYGQPEGARRDGLLTIESSDFRTQVGINVATGYIDEARGGAPVKKAVVRSSIFQPLSAGAERSLAAEAISMNHGMTPRDARPRVPLLVYDFNQQAGNNFKVYYSLEAPPAVAPCQNTMPNIGGWICSLD